FLWLQLRLTQSAATAQIAQEREEAARRQARTERYHTLLQRVRERADKPRAGWSWQGLEELAEARKLDTPARNLVDVRSEAVACLCTLDLRERKVLAPGQVNSIVGFSPDGKTLAVTHIRAAAWLFCSVHLLDVQTGQTRHKLDFRSSWRLDSSK